MVDEKERKDEDADPVLALLSEQEIEFYKRFDIPLPTVDEVKFYRRFGGPPIAFTRIERPFQPPSVPDQAQGSQAEAPLSPLSKPETDR